MQHATTLGFVPARRGLRPCALVLCTLGMFLTAFARPAAAADAEPRVARVAFVEGEASYLNADADEWTAVDVNAPLVTGDRFWSGSDGRAEIQLPGGVYARLSSDTEVELLEVSDQAVQVKVGVGTATFRLREVPAGQHVEFSTPTTALVARLRGVYRIDVAEDGQTTVAVREGEADAYLGDERYRLERGRGARIVDANYVTDDVPPIEVFDATQVANDPWDDWEAQRAARLQNASSYQYVDADVYGAEDLDDYGSWDRHETYGPIWRPTHVAAGWSPFTQGRWVWQDPWGWTWVDYEPWGWAPSHYGRWVYVQDAWAWAPGPVVARPAYAPATVGFLGVSVNTPSVSVSVGIGPSVGWVPLGWGEPVIPWWGGVWGAQRGRPWWGGWGGPRVVNNTVVKNINNVNITNINYANIDRGFYATSRDSFVRGDLRRLDVPRERMREAFRPLRGAPDVIPARESLFAARPDKLRGGRGGRPPQEILQRAAVSTRAVPAARPDFGRKLQLIERDKGAPVAPQQLRQLARQSAEREQAAPRVRTVAAKGRKPVVPEVTAQAPQRLNAPLQRAMRPGEARDERAARAEHSPAGQQRATLQRNDTPRDGARSPHEAQRDAALGERRMPPPGNAASRAKDPRRAAREDAATAGREGRALPQAQQPAAVQDRAQQASRDEAQRQRVERAQQQREQVREQRAQDPRTGRAERAVPGARQGEAVGAPQGRAQRDEAQRDQAGRARPEQAPTRQAAQAGRDAQREQAQRARRASTQGDEQAARARQDEARRQQVEQAQREGRQRQQADGARRDGEARQQREAAQAERTRQAAEARQRQADQQREAAQAERRQAQQATAQRQNAERQQAQRQAAQRQQAERQQAQRQAAQRQQAERQQAQRQATQRQQAERQQVQRQAAQRQQAQRQAAQRQQVERQQAQRQQSMQRQAQPQQQGEDPRSAQRREKRQQQRRQPEG